MKGGTLLALIVVCACARDKQQPEPPLGPVCAPQIRLLNAGEYRRTIKDLLGLEVAASLHYAESDYDSGVRGKIDENLFQMFLNEAERLADLYVSERRHPCLKSQELSENCLVEMIAELGLRAYRRPLTPTERIELFELWKSVASESNDQNLAVKSVLVRMLSSLHFLYRTEIGVRDGDVSSLTQYERASLISYAVTGSMPDEKLLEAAQRGELSGDGIRREVSRLIQTSAGRHQLVHFIGQWLRTDKLEAMAETPEAFPKLASPAQGRALYDEFAAYVKNGLFVGDGTLAGLLLGERTFINREVAPLYGTTMDADGWQPFTLGVERRGLLSLASVMAAHGNDANSDKDRPVIRGLLIKNRFLCEDIGLPSGIDTAAATMAVADDIPNFPELTTREQFTAIMNQAEECRACHQQFMPFGFLFGNFDALGRFHTDKGGRFIDTAVHDVPVAEQTRSFESHLELIEFLAASPVVEECFARNLVTYVVGTNKYDVTKPFAGHLQKSFTAIPALLTELLATEQLYQRSVEGQP